MIYFFRGIADPEAIGKSVVSDNYGLVIAGEGSYLDAFGPSSHFDSRLSIRTRPLRFTS